MVGGVELSDLPCLASGQNSNLTSNDMAYIRRQGISFDDDNDSAIVKILDEVPQPEYFLQLEIIRNHFSEAIKTFTQHLHGLQNNFL